MDVPMSDWFRSVPYSFDGAANAAKVNATFARFFAFAQSQSVATVSARNHGIPRQILQREEPKNNGSSPKCGRAECSLKKVISWLLLPLLLLLDEPSSTCRENDDLRHRNLHLQQYTDPREPSDAVNSNGKRPMTSSHRCALRSIKSSLMAYMQQCWNQLESKVDCYTSGTQQAHPSSRSKRT
jgi:hypothetical protein